MEWVDIRIFTQIECGEITDVKIKEIIGAPHRVECGENNVTVGNSTHSKLWAALQSEEWKDNRCLIQGGRRSD